MRYRLEYALFLLFGFLVRSLPLEVASSLSGALWRGLAPFSKRHRRALAHIKIGYPEASEAERGLIARDMWDTMGRVFAESFRLDEIAKSDRVTIEDEPQVRALLARSQGFVACAAHQGNWEVAAIGLAKLGYRTAGIYQPLKNPFVDAMARKMRAPLYLDGLLPKHEHRTAFTILRHVKSGGVLSVMADLRENRGVRVPFFGREAASTPFPALIAVSQDKPLYAAEVIREPGVRFRIRVREVEVARGGTRDADVLATTANLQAALEYFIRARPGQWMWGHRRWG